MTEVVSAATSTAATPAVPAADREKLKQVAKQFEAVFLRQMISSMRSAKLADDIFDSSASDQFRDMADGRTADSMAEKGALGIADMLLKQFSPPPAPTPAQPAKE